MKIKALVAVASISWGATAVAADPISLPSKGALPQKMQLACPAGTKQAGGLNTPLEAFGCLKVGAKDRIFHGPYVGLWANGQKQAVGQFENGWRTGSWTFYDQNGRKTGETQFAGDEFNGLRVEFNPDGSKKLEERWAMGRRHGAQKHFAQGGVISVVDFQNGQAVTK